MRWRRIPMYFDRPHRVRVDRCGGPADELLRCVNDALKKGLSIKCAYCYRVFFFSLDILSSRVVSSKELGRTWRGLSEMVFFLLLQRRFVAVSGLSSCAKETASSSRQPAAICRRRRRCHLLPFTRCLRKLRASIRFFYFRSSYLFFGVVVVPPPPGVFFRCLPRSPAGVDGYLVFFSVCLVHRLISPDTVRV